MKRLLVLLVTLSVAPVEAREPAWHELQTERFVVFSQLSERDTRRWAVELDQFIDSLQQLYSVNGLELPPLTMVLFDDARAFTPYNLPTNGSEVLGYFTNGESWSVIGLAGQRSNAETRRLIYHEAVHWFTSAFKVEAPLWFTEGLAELFSTFEVKDGVGVWGVPLEDGGRFLAATGVQSMGLLLRSKTFTGQHRASWFYSQSWLFLHYLMYGNGGARASELQQFLRLTQTTDVQTAFTNAFDMSYEDMERNLGYYLAEGQYRTVATSVRDRSDEMLLRDADPAAVEIALGRLALVSEHYDLARRHAMARIEATPDSPSGYELLALVEELAQNSEELHAALDEAIRLGSKDASVYSAKAWRLVLDSYDFDRPLDTALDPVLARTAADLFIRSISLRSRNRRAYDGLGLALLCVDTVTDQDAIVLTVGRLTLPTQGTIPLGQAAVEHRRGNTAQALALLRESLEPRFALPADWYQPIGALHDSWSASAAADAPR